MVYYRIRQDDRYLCGVQTRSTPYWGAVWAASETESKDQACDWQKVHGGVVEAFS